MRVLVIDTALGLCTAGVFEVGETARALGLRSEAMTKGHSERLGGLARDAVAEAGGFAAIDRIGVTVGPGSFTGLRVGLAFAQGLGAALGRQVVGVSTLDALAASVEAPSSGDVAALIDARRGQVYARFWRGGVAEGPPEALSLDQAADRIAALQPGAILCGSGAALFGEMTPSAMILDLAGPSPRALAQLAAGLDAAVAPPSPLYLRAPDATPPSRLPGQPRVPAKP